MQRKEEEDPEKDNVGRAEFCIDGVWRIFCDFGLDTASATVFCRQLGFNVNGTVPSSLSFNQLQCIAQACEQQGGRGV